MTECTAWHQQSADTQSTYANDMSPMRKKSRYCIFPVPILLMAESTSYSRGFKWGLGPSFISWNTCWRMVLWRRMSGGREGISPVDLALINLSNDTCLMLPDEDEEETWEIVAALSGLGCLRWIKFSVSDCRSFANYTSSSWPPSSLQFSI